MKGAACMDNMVLLAQAEIDVFAIFILSLLLFNLKKKSASFATFDQRLFQYVILSNIVILIFDAAMWIIDKTTFPGAVAINYTASAIYYFLNPVICYFWLIYTEYKITGDRAATLRHSIGYSVPVILNGVLTVASVFGGYLFAIGESNNYSRGPWFMLMPILLYTLFVIAIILVLTKIFSAKNATSGEKKMYLNLILFALPPFVGSVIQILFYGLSLIYVCTAASILLIFIKLQNDQINTDYLTGLANRRRLAPYLEWRMRERKENGDMLVVLMADIDGFKSINDRNGHDVGDMALTRSADIFRSVSDSRNDFIVRYGGDEFAVISEKSSDDELQKYIKNIETAADRFNKAHNFPYTLSFSIGYSIYREGMSADELLFAADKMMYEIKSLKKNNR